MLRKISERTGFTQTEIKVTLLLLVIFIIGFSYKTYFRNDGTAPLRNFDYSKSDSAFLYSDSRVDTSGSLDKENILDLNNKNTNRFPAKIIADENSIDLNTAGVDALTTIPGIGRKTAEAIIDLRKKRGGFNNLNNLLIIKNIGVKKLDKIKKYAYIK